MSVADIPLADRRPLGLSLEEAFRHVMPEDVPPPGTVWAWRASLDRKGYGQLGWRGRPHRAHRVSYEIFRGPIPEGVLVRHKNDTPIDVNPWNLELGTAPENSGDMVARDRQTSGSRHGNTRLVEADVIEMRGLHAAGWKYGALAERYKINDRTIGNIIRRETWRHI